MKKIYTLIIVLAFASNSFAQWKVDSDIRELPPQLRQYDDSHNTEPSETPALRGDAIWSSDFSDPAEWSTEVLYGNFGWEITSDNTGWFFNNSINSSSGAPYAFVWNDDPFENPTPDPGEYNLTTTSSIDVSGTEAALLEFDVYGARFTDFLNVRISTNGTDFVDVGNHQDIVMLTANGGSATTNPLLRQFNLTLDVQGIDDIWLQFNWQGEIAYGWMLDDVRLTIPPAHDLQLRKRWTGDIIFDYEYTMMPVEQSQEKTVGASFINMGANEEQVSLMVNFFEDGIIDPVFTATSDPVTSVQGEIDSIWFNTGFVPLNINGYTVGFELIPAGAPDDLPADNTSEKEFMITADVWANDDYNALTADFDGTIGGDTSDETEFIMGSAFAVYEPGTMFNYVQFRLAGGTGIGQEIEAALYVFGDDIEAINQTFSYYVIQGSDLSTTVDLCIKDPFELEVGQTYLVTLHHFGQDPTLNIRGSEGDDDISTFINGPYGVGGTVGWFFYDDFSPAIRLGSGECVVGIDESAQTVVQLDQNVPNPFSSLTAIPYSLEQAGKVTLDLRDITGKLVMQIDEGVLPSGAHRITIDAATLNAGVYFYTLTTGGISQTKKMTVQ